MQRVDNNLKMHICSDTKHSLSHCDACTFLYIDIGGERTAIERCHCLWSINHIIFISRVVQFESNKALRLFSKADV